MIYEIRKFGRISFSALAFCFFTAFGCADKSSYSSQAKQLTTAEIAKMQNADEAIIVDVRTNEEVVEGKIPGALHIDINGADFERRILALDKGKTIVLYCRSGGRAGQAKSFLEENGFQDVHNYGGYERWVKDNE